MLDQWRPIDHKAKVNTPPCSSTKVKSVRSPHLKSTPGHVTKPQTAAVGETCAQTEVAKIAWAMNTHARAVATEGTGDRYR